MRIHIRMLVGFLVAPAAYGFQYNDLERHFTLSTAYGIAAPAFSTATFQNPAGLIYNERFKAQVSGATTSTAFSNVGIGGAFLAGNGFVGGTVGFQTYNDQVAGSTSLGLLTVGLGALITKADLAIGFSGGYRLFGNASTGHWGTYNWGLDIGALIAPRGPFRIGVTVYDLLATVKAIGAGIAWELSPWAVLAVDATSLTTFRGIALKPALTINLYDFNLTAGYGIPIETSSSPWTPTGASFGVGFWLGSHIQMQAYYNTLSYLNAGLSIIL
jgi:hypothetical protein